MSNEPAEALAFSMLTTPRPISEYHEDMGSVLWWLASLSNSDVMKYRRQALLVLKASLSLPSAHCEGGK